MTGVRRGGTARESNHHALMARALLACLAPTRPAGCGPVKPLQGVLDLVLWRRHLFRQPGALEGCAGCDCG